ncbi:MAG: ABC transporter permease [Patescibacteria group bacterium]|nr:ABC transporter permease [Patescibacteria group bacterium]
MFTEFKRISRFGYQSFMRDRGSSVATVFVMVIAISLVTFLMLFQGTAAFVITSLESRVDISTYFLDTVFEEEILQVRDELVKLDDVRDVQYISKDKALEKFLEEHKGDEVILASLEAVGSNPLLSSLNIRTWDSSSYLKVTDFLEESFGGLISKVDFEEREPVIQRLDGLTSGIQTFGILFTIILGIVAVLVAFNTIRLAIYSTREEIEVMRLVGASNWFIRGPFVVQGVIVGIVAAIISLLLFIPATLFLSGPLENLISGFNIFSYFLSNIFVIFLAQLLVGVILGMISSAIAVKRYLKV